MNCGDVFLKWPGFLAGTKAFSLFAYG